MKETKTQPMTQIYQMPRQIIRNMKNQGRMILLKITNSAVMDSNESKLDEISENSKESSSKVFNKTEEDTK